MASQYDGQGIYAKFIKDLSDEKIMAEAEDLISDEASFLALIYLELRKIRMELEKCESHSKSTIQTKQKNS